MQLLEGVVAKIRLHILYSDRSSLHHLEAFPIQISSSVHEKMGLAHFRRDPGRHTRVPSPSGDLDERFGCWEERAVSKLSGCWMYKSGF